MAGRKSERSEPEILATWGSCWQFFTPLSDIQLTKSRPDLKEIHSEYQFGHCGNRKKIKFYAHVHLNHIDILGKPLVRGWINVMRIPTCIVLRGVGYAEDTFQSTMFAFQICVPRITYCHTHRRVKLHYYEWYIPYDMAGGMDWDIYFFGPHTMTWG